MARKAISPGSRTLYALNMPAARVRATMFRRQGRRTNPDGHSQSVELHEAASHTGIHAITGRPLRRNSSPWCDRPLLAQKRTSRCWRKLPISRRSNIASDQPLLGRTRTARQRALGKSLRAGGPWFIVWRSSIESILSSFSVVLCVESKCQRVCGTIEFRYAHGV